MYRFAWLLQRYQDFHFLWYCLVLKCLLTLVHNIIIINGGSSQVLKLHYMVNTCMVQWFDMVMFEGTMLCYLLFDSAVRICTIMAANWQNNMYQQNKLLHKFRELANIVLDQYLSKKKPNVSNLQHISCKFQKLPEVSFFILKECSFNLWSQFLLIWANLEKFSVKCPIKTKSKQSNNWILIITIYGKNKSCSKTCMGKSYWL